MAKTQNETQFLFHKESNMAQGLNVSLGLNQSETGDNDLDVSGEVPWTLINYETQKAIVQIVELYIFPVLFLVGVSMNLLNCLVFYRLGLRDRMNLCLFWLSMVDIWVLVSLGPVAFKSIIGLVDPTYMHEYYLNALLHTTGPTTAFLQTSGCISAVIAIERCVCVMFPLKAQSLISAKTMVIILGTITIVLQIACSTFPLSKEIYKVTNNRTGKSFWIMTSGKHKETLKMLYSVMFDLFAQFMLPLSTMCIVSFCTVVTVVKLKLAIAWRQMMGTDDKSNAQVQQIALTKMLIIISCIFISCSIPACLLSLARRIEPEFAVSGKYANEFIAFHCIGVEVLGSCNSTFNFIVYCSRSSRYRLQLRAVCCRRQATNSKQTEVTKTSSN